MLSPHKNKKVDFNALKNVKYYIFIIHNTVIIPFYPKRRVTETAAL